MKFLFDQNISQRILKVLPENYVGSSHVKKEGLINARDRQIWEFAKKNDFIIVTQDSDFNELNSLLGFPPKVIWIRSGNLKTQVIIDLLISQYHEIQQFIEDENYGCFEIVKIKI
jgi:predicted nuclease of predicted toxin-antitoxin system